MANLLRRSSSSPIERELRAGRPAAPPAFVEALAIRIQGRAGAAGLPLAPRRLVAAVVLTSATVALFAAFGGIGYAATATANVIDLVRTAANPVIRSDKGGGGHEGDGSGHDQYHGKKSLCHKKHKNDDPNDPNSYVLIVVDSSQVADYEAHGDFEPNADVVCLPSETHGAGNVAGKNSHFEFTGKFTGHGTLDGKSTFTWTDTSGQRHRFDSTSIDSLSFPSLISAHLVASGTVDRVAGYTATIDVVDNGNPGKGNDTYAIVIKQGSTVVYSLAATVISDGNIEMKKLVVVG